MCHPSGVRCFLGKREIVFLITSHVRKAVLKNFLKFMARGAAAALLLVGIACLPIIPMIQSPVSMYPVETHKLVSVVQFFGNFFVVGIRLQATRTTLPVMLAVFVACVFITIRMRRFVFGYAK